MRSPKHDVAFVPSLSGALVQAGGGRALSTLRSSLYLNALYHESFEVGDKNRFVVP